MQPGSIDPILCGNDANQRPTHSVSMIDNIISLSTNKLSPQQIELFKQQILAYKLISSNVALPTSLKDYISTIHISVSNPNQESLINLYLEEDIKSLDLESIDSTRNHEVVVDEISHIPPGSNVAMKLLYNILHPIQPPQPPNQPSLAFPPIVPEAFSAAFFFSERERLLHTRINERIQILEETKTSKLSESQKMKATIELKALKLFELQKKVRADVVDAMNRVTTSLTAVDPMIFSKDKKAGHRGARFVDRQSDPIRINFAAGPKADRSRKERMKHQEFLVSIQDRLKEFTSFHKNYCQQRNNKISKGILHFHSHYEKEEIKRLDKLAKDRINALKADDEEAYMKLIDEQKDTRLTHLLRQTDLFLESLTSSVVAQKLDILHKSTQDQASTIAEFDEELQQARPAIGDKVDYYSTAHKISEAVVQPSILVGGKLKEYQVKGLQWMISLFNNRLNGILADEMGLGKTIQTIALISYLLEFKNQNGPYLVIVPLSTMTNWSLEFEKWAPSLVKVEYKGTPQVRKSIQGEVKLGKFNILLTTYEYIIKDKSFLGKIKWLYMIIDEGHRMKNAQSKLVNTLTSYYSTRYRLILTGTPLQNNLPELWALLNFVLPKIFNSSRSFDEWFNAPFANTGEKLELNEEELLLIIRRLHKVLRPFLLRRLKKDVESELPDKIERVIKCPMSSLQAKLYTLVKEKTLFPTQGSAVAGIRRFNNTIMQLRKICNHPFVFDEVEQQINPSRITNDFIFRVAGKFELLKRMLGKLKVTGHRILMFFQMTTVMNVMEDFLNIENFPFMRLDGSTKAEDRSAMLKVFNASDSPYFIFLLSTRAGGLGLNLQSADTVIIFDSDWNPHQDLQAQDRAHRIGQTKEVRIFRLVTNNSVEEVIRARAQYKLNLDGKIIQAGKFDQKSTNEEREEMLRNIFDSEQQQEKGAKKTKKKRTMADEEETEEVDEEDFCDSDRENDVLNDDELNEILARSPDELELFHQLDQQYDAILASKGITRLILESELPKVYLNDPSLQDQEEEEEEFGRGQRAKGSKVAYDDHVSEEKWLKQFEVQEEHQSAKKIKKEPYKENDSVIDDRHKIYLKRKSSDLKNTTESFSSSIGSGGPKKSKLILKLTPRKTATSVVTTATEDDSEFESEMAHSQSFSSEQEESQDDSEIEGE